MCSEHGPSSNLEFGASLCSQPCPGLTDPPSVIWRSPPPVARIIEAVRTPVFVHRLQCPAVLPDFIGLGLCSLRTRRRRHLASLAARASNNTHSHAPSTILRSYSFLSRWHVLYSCQFSVQISGLVGQLRRKSAVNRCARNAVCVSGSARWNAAGMI